MARRRMLSAGLAALVVAGALAGMTTGQAVAGTTTPATGPTELTVLPAPKMSAARADIPVFSGTTGFLHQEQGSTGYLWTDYTTGVDTPQPALAILPPTTTRFLPVGGDRVAYKNGPTLTVGDPTTGAWVTYPLPQSGTSQTLVATVGVGGTRALVREGDGAHLLALAADGSTSEVAMTGLPSTSDYFNAPSGYQYPGDVVLIRSTPRGSVGSASLSLLRLDTGAAVPLPGVPATFGARISGDYLIWQNGLTVNLLKISDLLAGTIPPPIQVALPAGAAILDFAVVGQRLLLVSRATPIADATLTALPVDGSAATQLDPVLSISNPMFPYLMPGAGGVIAVGGTGTSQAVQRLTAAADGSVVVTAVRQLPPPAVTTATLTMDYGQVRQLVSVPQLNAPVRFGLGTTPLAAAAPGTNWYGVGPAGAGYISMSGSWFTPGPCAVDASCVRETDGNSYGPVYVTTSATAAQVSIPGLQALNLPTPVTSVVGADGTDVIVDSGGKQFLWEPGQGSVSPSWAPNGAALWQGTLWRATGPGQIQASVRPVSLTNPPTVLRTLSTGASCTASEVQVAQHWLYWSCGAAGPAGVHDLATNVGFSVPAGPVLLGDGYLLRHDQATGTLRLTDVHTDAVGADTTLATLPPVSAQTPADDRGITWTVDRTSGDVAYADADSRVHVLSTGVPASPVTAVASPGSGGYLYVGSPWPLYLQASRPLASWKLTFTEASTGKAVHVVTGGPTPAEAVVNWSGLTDAGGKAENGRYTWQFTAVPADAPTGPAAVAASGSLQVVSGKMPFHSYNGYGSATLLGVLGTTAFGYGPGTGLVYQGNGQGGWYGGPTENSVWNLGSGSGQVNAIVPFGDLNGDGSNDTLVRTGTGVLKYYPDDSNGDTFTSAPKTLGTGWNMYNRLVSVGDVNGDGHDDLVARDAAGALWLYAGNGHGGFSGRVLVGTGWNMYSRIIGVGDLNGDGAGDLVAMDAQGGLWRYAGNGHGGWGGRVRIGTGFGIYNALVGVGDMSGQGHDSLVGRDAAGVLWRYDSRSDGSFSSRVRLGTGWNIFSGLY